MKTNTNKPFPLFFKKSSITLNQPYGISLVCYQAQGLKIIFTSFN